MGSLRKVSSTGEGTTIHAGDIAVRNFGGCLSKTVPQSAQNTGWEDEVATI